LFLAELAEQRNLHQEIRLVRASPAQHICLGKQRQQIAPRCLADQEHHALRIRPIDEVKGRLVVADESAHLLSRIKVKP